MKKLYIFLLLIILPISVNAKDITSNCKITIDDKEYSKITDDKYTTYQNFNKDNKLKIICDEDINYVYIYYNIKSSKGLLNDKQKVGENNFLHELIKLENISKEVTINYEEDYSIAEIYVFNNESLPDWVEDWKILDKADLMLFSTHADDEQLFFAGLMPTYIDKGKKIQVIYFTNHYNNTNRYHEQLEGLWAIGIKYYPIISTFPDAYSTTLEAATTNLERAGYSRDDAIKYEVEQIRRFKPLVVVGHDEKGEYSHGQHILCTDTLKEAILKASDKEYDNNSLEKYNVWSISKLYLHLYDQNKIILNYDTPLESYNGMTAYEVSKLGYAKHYSQQYTWFTAWLKGEKGEYTKATQIKTYNPAYYGLYYTTVGEDQNKNDMFENIVVKNPTINFKEKSKEIINDIKNNNYNVYYFIGAFIITLILLIIVFRKRN